MCHGRNSDELTKYYGDTRGIEDLTLDVCEGEVFGSLGSNGAGKSTTIRTLMEVLVADRRERHHVGP